MKKHILLYTDDFGVGGVAQYNHSLICGLVAQGYHVTSVQTKDANPLVKRQQELGVHHEWLEFDTLKYFHRTLTDSSEAQKIFLSAKPDLIIFSQGTPFASFAAKRVAIEMGIPYIVVEGFVTDYLAKKFASLLDELENHYKQAKAVIAVSSENFSLLQNLFRLPKNKGQVIYYGRPPEYFDPPSLLVRERLRQEFGIPANAIVCFTAARLESVKGFQYQLEAIKQLKQSSIWDKLYFVWAGSGSLESQLKEVVTQLELTKQVKVLGQRFDILDWLDASDIFILPSEWEGMPLAVIEAMAKGLPVIASAVSGIPEELGNTGKLLPSPVIDQQATVRELVTTILAWSTDPNLRYSIGQACQKRAKEIFREERMIKETLEVIERALLPDGDYVSPGFSIVLADQYFPNIIVGDKNNCGWHYFRREIAHNWYVDKRQPKIGFLNRDEVHILYNTALLFKDKKALEIGCWLGWSACHLALAGVKLDVIDPLLASREFQENVSYSLSAAGVLNSVNLVPGNSPQKVEELANQLQRKWPLIFIDGNHDAPGPLNDAIACEKFAEEDAIILFHDLASPDVAQGLNYLKQRGWNTMIYQTMQIMGVAWRGNIQPVIHKPDPNIEWNLPSHLQGYSVSGIESDRTKENQEITANELIKLVENIQVDYPLNYPEFDRLTVLESQNKGKKLLATGNFEEALLEFNKAIQLNPLSWTANKYLSLIYWQKRELEKSLKHYLLAAQFTNLLSNYSNNDEFLKLVQAVRTYTMVSPERLFSLYSLAKQICLDDIPGNFVECGTWRGGTAAVLAFVIKHYSLRPRKLYVFDTFTGMPNPTDVDKHNGIPANNTAFGVGSLKTSIFEGLDIVCKSLDVRDIVVPVQGLFSDTLPQYKLEIGDLAFLHADADWYQSTIDIFNHLFQQVIEEGIIQIDDYGHWEGCRKAIHDFEISQSVTFPLRKIDYTGVWFRKENQAEYDPGRALWLLAEASEKSGDIELAEKASHATLKLVSRLLVAEEMLARLHKTEPTLPPKDTLAEANFTTDIAKSEQNSPDKIPLVPQQIAQQSPFDSPQFIKQLNGCINLYEIDPSDESVLVELRLLRRRIADFWLNLPPEQLETCYLGNLGKAHKLLAQSDFKQQRLTDSEQIFVDGLSFNLAKGFNTPKAINYRLVAMLYPLHNQVLSQSEKSRLPAWLK